MILKILRDIVSIPSYPAEDGKSGEEKYVAFLENFFRKNCSWLKTEKQAVVGERYNLIASSDCSRGVKLIFCCHLDTVRPTRREQLNPTIKDNRLYGLGAVDMKGGTAALLYALSQSVAIDGIKIIFYCDEEFGFLGMRKLIEEKSFSADLAIFPEPTNLKIVNGCRGLIEVHVKVKGETAHSKDPRYGSNAILLSTDAFSILERRINTFRSPEMGVSVCNLASLDGYSGEKNTKNRDGNRVPDTAKIIIEARTSDRKLNAREFLAILEELILIGGGFISETEVKHDLGSFYVNPKSLVKIEEAIKASGLISQYDSLDQHGYFDSQMFFEQYGIPVASFGPGPSSLSHKQDEYVEIDSLKKASEVYTRLF
ncbi:M20/M25/M40 family metallo-hydrolase [Candidatus Falkowbacteria bacterium]|nr:M20/M25/M40 family metallo-hydrolase [Candidatus Falkowbacteria bacterium]